MPQTERVAPTVVTKNAKTVSANRKEAHSGVFVVPSKRLGLELAQAGGKGANTGELVRASFPVPSGFVITTEAYDGFVMYSIGWARRSPGRSASSRAVALAIRTPFEGTPLDRAATPRLMFGDCGTSY